MLQDEAAPSELDDDDVHVEDVELIADDELKAAPPPKRSCVLSWKGSMASAAE